MAVEPALKLNDAVRPDPPAPPAAVPKPNWPPVDAGAGVEVNVNGLFWPNMFNC